jgi:hypothetical protein
MAKSLIKLLLFFRRKKKCIRFANIDDGQHGLIGGNNGDQMFNGMNSNNNDNGSSCSMNGVNSDDDYDDYDDEDEDDEEDYDMTDDDEGQDEYDEGTENEEILRANENKQHNKSNFTPNYSDHITHQTLPGQHQNKLNHVNSHHQSKKPNIDPGFDNKQLIMQQIHQMQQQMQHQQIHNQQLQHVNGHFQTQNPNNIESINR